MLTPNSSPFPVLLSLTVVFTPNWSGSFPVYGCHLHFSSLFHTMSREGPVHSRPPGLHQSTKGNINVTHLCSPGGQASPGTRVSWFPGRQVHSRRLKRNRAAVWALVPPLPRQRSRLPFVPGTRSHDHRLACGWGKEGDGTGAASLSLPGTGGEQLTTVPGKQLPRENDCLHAQVTQSWLYGRKFR